VRNAGFYFNDNKRLKTMLDCHQIVVTEESELEVLKRLIPELLTVHPITLFGIVFEFRKYQKAKFKSGEDVNKVIGDNQRTSHRFKRL